MKVLKSAAWDETLKGFVQTFADRKTLFIFSLSIHTGMGVVRANDKLDELMARYRSHFQAICPISAAHKFSHRQDGRSA